MCRHCGKAAPYRIRAAANQAHEKEEKKHVKESTNSGNQQEIAKLEEQLKAAKKENKRLATRVQQSGKARDTEVEPEDACDEEEAANLDELQTLVDLRSNYFPDSVHNATLRAKLDAKRKKKEDAKPVQAQISNVSRRLEKKRKAKAAVDQKIIEMRKQLEHEEASAAELAVDIDELEKSCKCYNDARCSLVRRLSRVRNVSSTSCLSRYRNRWKKNLSSWPCLTKCE